MISVLLLHDVLSFCLPFKGQHSCSLAFPPMIAARRQVCVGRIKSNGEIIVTADSGNFDGAFDMRLTFNFREIQVLIGGSGIGASQWLIAWRQGLKLTALRVYICSTVVGRIEISITHN